jgi:hypothetical protein
MFDQRWQIGAARARLAPEEPEATPPFGFTTRVLALARKRIEGSLEEIWTKLVLRALAGVAALLLVLAAVDTLSAGDGASVLPDVDPANVTLPWTP